jgi:hypothetical protein
MNHIVLKYAGLLGGYKEAADKIDAALFDKVSV